MVGTLGACALAFALGAAQGGHSAAQVRAETSAQTRPSITDVSQADGRYWMQLLHDDQSSAGPYVLAPPDQNESGTGGSGPATETPTPLRLPAELTPMDDVTNGPEPWVAPQFPAMAP